ncbi:MAG: cytochrome c [Caldilineales bacterium]|nr:cytochrome c [Caldilineales bacterium]
MKSIIPGRFVRVPAIRFVLLVVAVAVLAACARGAANGQQPQTEEIERGAVIYTERCAVCHGPNGEGEPNWKTPKEDGTYPAPPHTADGHTWHHGDDLLFQIIKGGGDSLEIPGFNSNMPAFAETLNDDDILAVLAYLKSLWPDEQRQFQHEVSLQESATAQ